MKRSLILTASLFAIAAIAALAWWWFRVLPPRNAQLYDRAVELYSDGNYHDAVQTLERARRWTGGTAKVNTLLGWSYWRLGGAEQADASFKEASRQDPHSYDAKLGLAFSSMALDHPDVALPLLEELARVHPGDNEVRSQLASAYSGTGQNQKAAYVYRDWLELDPSNATAQAGLLRLFGYSEYRSDLPLTPAHPSRAAQLRISFRAHGDRLQALGEDHQWRDIYSVGVNIGPAKPGEFPSTASRDFSTYQEWFDQIGAMHSNTVRIYTILPPAFYQALRAYNLTARQPLWLIQEVWISDGAQDLYDPETEKEFRRELLSTINVVHGAADIPYRHGHNYGIYTADVSPWVLAFAVGREVEPKLVLKTDRNHASETRYRGKYVSITSGNPTETWFARMCDTAAGYEIDTYNAERPLTVVNWPPLDPMGHPTEANYVDELRIRKQHGEVVTTDIPQDLNDADAVSVDVAKFRVEPAFGAGLFALYHVYQHWPDFMFHEKSYEAASDAQGPNRYLGYLLELKKAYSSMPLLIGEYGIATSTSSAHVHPEGWNNGGLSEAQQAELLVRMSRNIHDSGAAGGIVFEWQDEWWKHVHDSFTADFEQPWDRNPVWLNRLDPEKQFGLIAFAARHLEPELRGVTSDWVGAQQLYSPAASLSPTPGRLLAAYATSDYAYLYLRLDIAPGAIDWKTSHYWIALNTLPGQAGSRDLPALGLRLEQGANFLIELSGNDSAKILIAHNYDPNQPFPTPGRARISHIWRKQDMSISVANYSTFEDMVIEANPARFGRDGTEFPAVNYDRSPMPYGTADRSRPDFSSNAAWFVNPKVGTIEVRVPWGLLLFTDPSQQQVFGGTDSQWRPLSRPSPGVSVVALQIAPGERNTVVSSLPELRNGRLPSTPSLYTWEKWNKADTEPVFKASYFALQKLFSRIAVGLPGSGAMKAAAKP